MARGIPGGGGGSGNGGGGGKPPGAGSKKGDLFGDQWVLLRDLDPSDGGGNGEPVLDDNGNQILVGVDGSPIFLTDDDGDGKFEVPEAALPLVQEVELERANVARAPTKVMDKSLATALAKIDAAAIVDIDAAGRIVCDGVTIDSPLENLALYKYLMTRGATATDAGGWSEDLVALWPDKLQALVGDPENPSWDPSALLGAAFAKEGKVTFDAMLYENTTLGVNKVLKTAAGSVVDYFEFSDSGSEAYEYDRQARYGDVQIGYYQNIDADADLEYLTGNVFDVVFGSSQWSDAEDKYFELNAAGDAFTSTDATSSGVNDFAQAADDARAVILFLHNYSGELIG
jgi:hypothetical protein